ncbi:hypothetical protein [Lactiplantibacillus plantarum]|uniref:hypothetical protein n=1 Tax=Lactiplantibacillus TaxID=2767842 RepID=UPI0021C8FB36|nr:hypothetical protein [Lactiplantibacillus plantarum]MCG5035290.1 hypothetical protein [Lactiplantibacillus plantarum]WQC50169.1 hypothetical protein TUW04_14595 [Lactiplantibacillus plantarum]WQG56015.1 hypothetical protein T1J70_05825 [Lactiplantibacillus plantarum]WQH18542.1 hypothetical protein T1I15_15835 [Lactiplantibacillus plantarum]WRM16408.1 hypothetical protein T1K45_09275 [Lactiplantibacillus plantarum]
MSLQFVLGPAKMDHRRTMVAQLVATLMAKPQDQFFIWYRTILSSILKLTC